MKTNVMHNPVDEILMLPIEERMRAVETIWESITHEPGEQELTQAQLEELQSRMQAFEEGKMKFHSWDEVKENIRRNKK